MSILAIMAVFVSSILALYLVHRVTLLIPQSAGERIVYGFYVILILLKSVYALINEARMFWRIYEHGNMGGSSFVAFCFTGVVRLFIGLIPYVTFWRLVSTQSRFIMLSIGVGLAVAGCDIYVDYCFRNETDPQVGIAMMFMYIPQLAAILFSFLLLNYGPALITRSFNKCMMIVARKRR